MLALQVNAAGPVVVCLDTIGSPADTVLYVRQTCDNPNTEVGCDDGGRASQVQVELQPGIPYFIIVDTHGVAHDGNLNLSVGPCP